MTTKFVEKLILYVFVYIMIRKYFTNKEQLYIYILLLKDYSNYYLCQVVETVSHTLSLSQLMGMGSSASFEGDCCT
jgi:hypothetical protein